MERYVKANFKERIETLFLVFKIMFQSSKLLFILMLIISTLNGLSIFIGPYFTKVIIDGTIKNKFSLTQNIVIGFTGVMFAYFLFNIISSVNRIFLNIFGRIYTYKIEKNVAKLLMNK